MLPNDDPQDSSQPDYGILDYAKQDEPNVAYEQDGLETPKVGPDPYAALGPPARGIFAKWLKVLTRPSVATFASEIPAADWGTTLLGVLIYTVFYFLLIIIMNTKGQQRLLEEGYYGFYQPLAVIGFIFEVIFLIIGSGSIYGLAKASGKGGGDFATQTYLYSLYAIPIAIMATLLSLVPNFSNIAPLAAGIYGLFLTYYMVRAAHRLNPGSARWLVLFSFITAVIALFIFVIFLISLFPIF